MADMQVVKFNPESLEGETIQVGEQEEFCRQVEGEFTPFVGQEFDDIEEAVIFYKIYALAAGFDVRRYTTKKWRDGEIKSKLLVCNREGFKHWKGKKEAAMGGEEADESCEQHLKRRRKVTRIGCMARIRLFMMNGVLCIDRFHEGHNHEPISVNDREFQKLSRNLTDYHKQMIIDNSRLKIGATRTFKMCKEYVNGFENIGASLNDFKNFHRDVKCFIHGRDGQLFIDHFKEMAANRPGFYFDYDVDSDGSLRRAIWADNTARRNYQVFGDAVSFDPTYSTNKYSMVFTPFTGVDHHGRSITFAGALIAKEDYESFNWVFSRFLTAMGGKEPEYIITDQDPGIIKSFPLIFKTARHRFCMWHIMNKVPSKYGVTKDDYNDFMSKLNDIIWDDDLEAAEYDARWAEIMEEHGLTDNEWFSDAYACRKQWVMAHWRDVKMGSIMRTTQRSESENSFFKKFESKSGTLVEFWMRFESAMDQQRYTQKKLDHDSRNSIPKLGSSLAIEKYGAKLYTYNAFYEFREEVQKSIDTCTVGGYEERDELEITIVKDASRKRNYKVTYNPGTIDASCSCKMFERKGLLCRHILWIYSAHGQKIIPSRYVDKRWMSDAKQFSTFSCEDVTAEGIDIVDGKQIEMSNMWSEIHEIVGLLKAKGKGEVETLCSLLRAFKVTLSPSPQTLSKNQELEKILGCTTSEKITILPPKQSKNKGSGKRLLSSKTKAIVAANKKRRMCNNCKQMAHHDKRNCPNQFAEQSPSPYEGSSEEEEEEVEEEEESKTD